MITLPLMMVALFSPSPIQIQTSSALAEYEIVEVAEIQTEDKAVEKHYPVGLEGLLRTRIITYLGNAIGTARVLKKGQTTMEAPQPEPARARRTVALTVVIEDYSYEGDFSAANTARGLAAIFTVGASMIFKSARQQRVTTLQLKAVFRDAQTSREIVTLQHRETLTCGVDDCHGGRSDFTPLVTDRAASGLAELIQAHWRNSSAPMTSSRKQRIIG